MSVSNGATDGQYETVNIIQIQDIFSNLVWLDSAFSKESLCLKDREFDSHSV